MAKFITVLLALVAGLLFGSIIIGIAYYSFELRGFYMALVCVATAGLAVLPAILYSTEDL